MIRLFHVSETSTIKKFEPRPPPSKDSGVSGLAVWAIDEAHLCNYLLPRDCPRITFATSTHRVVAVEEGWRAKIQECQLFLYEFHTEKFKVVDAGAGYYVARETIVPKSVVTIQNLLYELENRQVEVRFLPQLWDLRDEISSSAAEFSIIRFRNAQPRY